MTSLQRIVALMSVPLLFSACPTRTIYYDGGTDAGREGGSAGSAGEGDTAISGGHGGSGGRSGGNGGGGVGAGGSAGAVTTGGAAGGAAGAAGSTSSGAGGSGVACQPDVKRCGADGLETCLTNGTWGSGGPCGPHQSCVSTGLSAECRCNADAVCASIGMSCTSSGLLASCNQDGDGCFYETSADSCPDGACTGVSGAAFCCTNACSNGAAQCTAATSIQTCGPLANACTGWTPSACSAGTVCERGAQASCLDPDWAEWPVPNDLTSYLAGAPNLQAYADNHDGSVLDSVTGLIWEKAAPGTTYDLTSARAY